MGKIKAVLTLVLLMLSLTEGFSFSSSNPSKKAKRIAIDEYGVIFTFPRKWEEVQEPTPYDLQCFNKRAYASFFAFKRIDLAENLTPEDIYNLQIEDIFSRRKNIRLITPAKRYSAQGKQIMTSLYSAEKEGNENYYYCCLIEFPENPDTFVWCLFTSRPSTAKMSIKNWDAILASAERIP